VKHALISIMLDIEKTNVVEVEIPDPGIVLHGHVVFVPESAIVMRRDTEPRIRAQPILIAQINPDAKPRRRRFVVLPGGQVLDTPDALTYRAMIVNPNDGRPFAVYEADIPAVELVAAPPDGAQAADTLVT